MKLPQKLKYLRKQMGLSQLELSEKLQVSRQAVSGWEAGTSKPSIKSLKNLGTLYNVPLEYLLNEDAPEPDHVELTIKEDQSHGRNIRNIVLIFIGIGIVGVLLCAMIFMDSGKKAIPINHMEGSEIETGEDFEMEW